jgi:hypothetical protein
MNVNCHAWNIPFYLHTLMPNDVDKSDQVLQFILKYHSLQVHVLSQTF